MCAAAHWKSRSPESLHQQIGRAYTAILPAAQKRRKIRVDRRSPQSIRGPEEDISTPPILAVPKERAKLYLYVAAHNNVVSTTLVVERTEEGKVQSIQRPIYYLNMLL